MEDDIEKYGNDIRTGTVVVARWQPFSPWDHYGIVVEDGGERYVYDNDPDDEYNEQGGSVGYFELEKWLERRRILKVYDSGLKKEEIENEVKKYKHKKFDWVMFNCRDLIRKITKTDHKTGFKVIDDILYPEK